MGEIRKDNLHESLIEELNELANIDLSGYQEKTDNNLVTESKDLVGAINELFQSANNGKELIANAIGEPVSADDTFSAMSNDINSLLSTFKTNMMNNGITVESNDRFKSLIDKIATMVEEGSGKGIQFVEGTIEPYNNNGVYSVDIELNFVPTIIITETDYICDIWTGYEEMGSIITYYNKVSSEDTYFVGGTSNVSDSSYIYEMDTMVNSGNKWTFDFNIVANNPNFLYTFANKKYYAIGVGEEDTTLLDSLKSILAEEGVTTTEEDDMASLITKVDEEFNDKNNEITGLNNTINTKNNELNTMKQNLVNVLNSKGVNVNTNNSLSNIINSIQNIKTYPSNVTAGDNYTLYSETTEYRTASLNTYIEVATFSNFVIPGGYRIYVNGRKLSNTSHTTKIKIEQKRNGDIITSKEFNVYLTTSETSTFDISDIQLGDVLHFSAMYCYCSGITIKCQLTL